MTTLTAPLGQIRKFDWAVALLALVTLPLALFAPEQAWRSALFVARNVVALAPFFALSVGLAAYVGAAGADNLIARAFTGSLPVMILLASLMGALSPFCSCGVIPIIAALLSMGVPLAPVMAFWLSSPLMDPSMFALTAGTLGIGFAVAKTVAAVGVGMLAGFGVLALQRVGFFGEILRPGVGDGGCAGGKIRDPKPVAWAFWREAARRRKFVADARKTTLFLGKWLLLAFLIESLMVAYVPAEVIGRLVGGDSLGAILLAAAVGVPAYLNGAAALPLVAGFMQQGMSPGAAMAFLVGGGATSIPAALAVAALARTPVFLAYLAFALLGAIFSGLFYAAIA